MIIKPKHVVLIVCDTNFKHNVNDEETYTKKLFNFAINKEKEKEVEFITVKGKYSFGVGLDEIKTEDRNKTSFIRAVNDYLNMFNEVIIITNYEYESYLTPLKNMLQEESIPLTQFSYATIS